MRSAQRGIGDQWEVQRAKKRKGLKEFIHTYTRCVDNWEDYSYNSSSHAVYPRSGVMMRDGGGGWWETLVGEDE